MGQLLEHIFIGRRRPGCGFLNRLVAQPVKEDFAELLWRAQVKGLAGQGVGFCLQGSDGGCQFVTLRGEKRGIDLDARLLHVRKNRQGGQFDFFVNKTQSGDGLYLWPEGLM